MERTAFASRTPNYHYAAARRAESAARTISVRSSIDGFLHTTPADEITEARRVMDSYYKLAAAHRQAAHRLERGQRIRNRLSDLVFPMHCLANKVRRFRNERRAVNV
ncbi:hypothetical protein ACFQ0G_53150 [Streptomyces chiangmaiensis]|uniref:hypothetical protein n=1 Tax=Streptomyces chiangmaiensis TaxID=766497 RepID=UPI0031EC46E4